MTEALRPSVAAVILAAGASARMGQPKLLLIHHGVPLLGRAVDAAVRGGCDDVVVVLGADHERYGAALEGTPARIVHNPEFARGMSSSIRVGVEALREETRAAIIMLADQPFIDRDVIRRLIDTYRTSGVKIVTSAYGGVRGAPVLFDRALFLELLLLEGDQGARQVLATYPRHVTEVEIPVDAARDVDTPDDARRLVSDQ
jgi:molybdenum cofactor cytidylyltransferase